MYKLDDSINNLKNIFIVAKEENYKPILGNLKLCIQDEVVDIEVNSIEIEGEWFIINDWLRIK